MGGSATTWVVSGSLIITFLLCGLLWFTHEVLLILFAGILFGTFLHGVASPAAARLRISYRLCLCVAVALLLGATWGFLLNLGPKLSDQLGALSDIIPRSIDLVTATMKRYPYLSSLSVDPQMLRDWLTGGAMGSARSIFGSLFGYLFALALFIFTGIYLAWNPKLYRLGLESLVPRTQQEKWSTLLDAVQSQLQWWIVGRIISMLVIGLMVTTGLWLLGVPLALAFGVLAALLTFVPYVGPVLAVVPPVFFVLVNSWSVSAVDVLLLYLVIEVTESYMITPLIQRKAVSLPPALTLASMSILGSLSGALGVALAAPLTVVTLAVIEESWSKYNR